MLAQSYNLLAICAGGKLYLACTKTIFSIIFLSNVRTNSLFHTVEQRIYKGISKNTYPNFN